MRTYPAIKRTVLCTLAGCLMFSSTTLAQSITLSKKNASLQGLLVDIYRQSGYYFYCNSGLLSKAMKVDINVKEASLDDVLKICFKDQRLSYTIDNKIIVIKEKNTPQNILTVIHDVKGKVLNEKGEPLSGATITTKGTGHSVVTDADGGFKLPDAEVNAILVISNVGYETREIAINNRKEITIQLNISASRLDEIQIIGYGITTKRLTTGSISKVSAEDIEKQPVTNPLQALSGRVPGLLITQSSGLPGAPISVQIRGQNSIAASNNPLYVVDGVPFNSTPIEMFGGPNSTSAGLGSPLNQINPLDIESIEVLKDADATAIYGSRGSNGVILITTKKGKTGKTKFDANVNTGFGAVTKMAKTPNTQQYLQIRKDAFNNDNLRPTAATAPDLLTWDTTASTDWQKYFYGGTSKTVDATTALSGGNSNTHFLLSGTYHGEGSVYPTNDRYNRNSVHLNIEHVSMNQKLNVSTNAFYTTDNNNLSGTNRQLLDIARLPPNYPVYDSLGKFYWGGGLTNLVAQLLQYYKSQTDNLNGNLAIRYTILPNLNFKANLGYNKISINQIYATPILSQNSASNPKGSARFSNQYTKTYLFEPQLTYSTPVLRGNVEVLAGATIQNAVTRGLSLSAVNYSSDLLLQSQSDGTISSKSSSGIDYKYASIFTRVTYNWMNKYILNTSYRRDGSSRFGPGKQFGNFGSIGMGWIFSKEKFLEKRNGWLSYGKLRASYGTTGNDGIGDYGYLSTYLGTALYGSSSGLSPSRIANDEYHWEVNKKFEVAVELGLIHNRILITTAWFDNHTNNQLVGYPLPSITGFSSYQANLPALVENKGLEVEISSTNIKSKDFTWVTSANLTVPKNTLVKFPGLAASAYANSYVIGQPLSIIQRLHFLKVDPQTGLASYQDVNKNGAIEPFLSSYNNQGGDYLIVGKTSPDWFGGVGNDFTYKNWKLDIFFQITQQHGFNLNTSYNQFGRLFNVWDTYLGYWTKSGDITNLPKPRTASSTEAINYSNSDAIISNASYMRLKNISLSYDLPEKWLHKNKISNCRIYLQGQNLLTITNYRGYDPEVATNTTVYMPPLKVVVIGVQCSF